MSNKKNLRIYAHYYIPDNKVGWYEGVYHKDAVEAK